MSETKTIDPSIVAQIVRSYVGHTKIKAADLPNLITIIHQSLAALDAPSAAAAPTPAVAINRSYGRDFVICLDCGWRGQMLRRHLTTAHGLLPREYRTKWGLKDTHPIITPAYTDRRSTLAKQFGLGHGGRARAGAPQKAALPTAASSDALDPAFAASLSARPPRGRPRRTSS
jgi:predicted transcriptional regulator